MWSIYSGGAYIETALSELGVSDRKEKDVRERLVRALSLHVARVAFERLCDEPSPLHHGDECFTRWR